MRRPVVFTIVAAVIAAACVGAVLVVVLGFGVDTLVKATSLPPGQGEEPATSYQRELGKTIAAFDADDRAAFDALYTDGWWDVSLRSPSPSPSTGR